MPESNEQRERSPGTVLVTGGTRGIGRAVVEHMAGLGAPVALTWHSDEALGREVAESLGERVRAFPLDLRDRERPASLVAEVEEALGPIEGLVNNAGMERSELLAMASHDSWEEVIDTNLGGAFRVCRAVLRVMVSRRRGSIVNISSLSALKGVAGQTAYAASKGGLLAMTKSLAREMGKRGIRANAVIPGYVATKMTSHLKPEMVDHLRAAEALKSGVTPQDVASTVAFLLSDQSSAVTGQSFIVDAGNSA
ncbi:MAG: SDR family oxidoreductase [Acidobacteriota bacterium]